jgi:hypothetical protein
LVPDGVLVLEGFEVLLGQLRPVGS